MKARLFGILLAVVTLAILTTPSYALENNSSLVKCPEKRPEICYQVYAPVCGKIVLSNGEVIWKTFPNGCEACKDLKVVGYIPGKCKKEYEFRERIREGWNHSIEKIVNIVVNNKTINVEISHDVYKNESMIVIDHEVHVEVKGKVSIDKELEKIIIFKNNKTYNLSKDILPKIKRCEEEHRYRLELALRRYGSSDIINQIINNSTTTLDVEDNKIIITTKSPVKVRVLWIIPVSTEVEVKTIINQETGEEQTVLVRPWWWFLVTGIFQ